MNVELTREEAKVLFDALNAYKMEPAFSGMVDAIIGSILANDSQEKDASLKSAQSKAQNASESIKLREIAVVQIQAKLIKAMNCFDVIEKKEFSTGRTGE